LCTKHITFYETRLNCPCWFSLENSRKKEKETGITIHYVNANYDEGAIIKQAKTTVSPEDTPEEIAGKIHELEYAHFPKVIEKILANS